MAKLPTLSSLVAGFQSAGALNVNFANIISAFTNTLSRDGSSPNQMEADFDLNDNDVLNGGVINARGLTLNGTAVTADTPLSASLTIFQYATRATIVSTNVPAAVDIIQTFGYQTVGDGGEAYYKRVGSEPSHPGKVQSNDGAWFELLPEHGNIITLESLGINLDGVTDNSTLLADIGTGYSSFDGTFTCGPGTVYTDGTFTIPRHASLICDGTVFTAEGSAGSFTDAVVRKVGATPTQIADMTGDETKGSFNLDTVSAHGLSVGDTVLLYNPTDSSFSSHRTDYREGEFVKVSSVGSTTDFSIDSLLFAAHAAASTEVYHCTDMATGTLEGFTVKAIDYTSTIDAIRLEFCEGLNVKNVAAELSADAAFSVFHCYRCNFEDLRCNQWDVAGGGTQYGLIIANCQEITSYGGDFNGWRHGISVGGGTTFSIPNRRIIFDGFTARNRVGGIAAADWHGNTEYCKYINGTCHGGGFNHTGDFHVVDNCDIFADSSSYGIYGRELKGNTHTYKNIRFYGGGNDTSRGAFFDIGGGGGSAMSTDTDRGGHTSFEDIYISAESQERSVIRWANQGFAGSAWSFSVRNAVVNMPSGVNIGGMVQVSTASGNSPARVEVTGFQYTNPNNDTVLLLGGSDGGVKVRQDVQTGTKTHSITSGTSEDSESHNFTFHFAKAPAVSVNLDDNVVIGSDVAVANARNITTSDFDSEIHLGAGGNFGSTTTKDITWIATLREF